MFETTRWSLILAARGDSRDTRAALEHLCHAYRKPVLAYVRRQVDDRDLADDLTQAFFVSFLENRIDTRTDPADGRFRNFLLASLRNFLANARDSANTLKRGGGTCTVTLGDDEENAPLDPNESPEQAYERAWAMTVLAHAVTRLRQESVDSGKQEIFDCLCEFLIEPPEPARYEILSRQLGMRRNTVAVTVHRLRERLRELVRLELAETVSDSQILDDEMHVLRAVLTGT